MDNIISEDYKNQMKQLHEEGMGKNSRRAVPRLHRIPEFLQQYQPETLLDFGCGQGGVHRFLNEQTDILADGFDPCVEEFETMPNEVFDVLISVDVMEHIELDKLEEVLKLIDSKFSKAAYLDIHSGPAAEILPDGRNAHLIQEGPEWWIEQIEKHMNVKVARSTTRPTKAVNLIFFLERV